MRGIFSTAVFLAILIGLGTADALFVEQIRPFASVSGTPEPQPTTEPALPQPTVQPDTGEQPTEAPAEDGVRKQEGPDVGIILGQFKFQVEAIAEPIFLSRIVSPEDGAMVTGAVLLKDGDRAGVIAWADSPKIKLIFLALKEALHESFTPAVQDLVDETQRREGRPVRNFLSFLDPGISEERIVFVRVRERLYEVHIAKGSEEVMFDLIDAVTE